MKNLKNTNIQTSRNRINQYLKVFNYETEQNSNQYNNIIRYKRKFTSISVVSKKQQ